MLVGEASGENEARDQLPFRPYARAGSILERTLRRMGLSRQQFATTNVLRCRPRGNLLEGMPYEAAAISQCQPNLADAIARFRPKVIVPLGNIPLRAITGLAGPDRGISNLRGYVLPTLYPGVVALPSYHPSFIGRGAQHLMGVFARDILRAIAVAQGKDTGYILDPQGEHKGYVTHPTPERADALRGMLKDNPDWPISFDLETYESTSLDEDARTGFTDTEIRLIQFSYKPGYGMALPWKEPFISIAEKILALPNPKLGHNISFFDLKVLKAVGARIGRNLWPNGPLYDTLDMFRTWQPDLPANLQFAASFANFPFAWKHLSGTDLEFYGSADVDATLRLAGAAQKAMRGFTHPLSGLSLWDGYERSVYEVRPVLRDMEDRGIPVDDIERLRLGGEFDLAERELDAELDRRCPLDVKSVHPKEGYKKEPKDTTGMIRRVFLVPATDHETGEPALAQVERWCRIEPFTKNSSQQLLRYMRARGHVPPKDGKKQSGETTAAKELVRLADKTGDDFYLKVIECREFGKMKGTYVDGYAPGVDGRIHTSFTFNTATWQLAAKNPNVVNIPKHGRLAKPIRRMFQAPEGFEFSEWDFKSYHVLTTGFNAESAQYCVVPSTRILTADLQWKQALDVREGEILWGFDELPNREKRKLRKCVVEKVSFLERPCVRIHTDRGVVSCSTEHMWLSKFSPKAHSVWREAKKIQPGMQICYFVEPWKSADLWEQGYIAGILDGEGSLGEGCQLSFAQRPGVVADMTESVLCKHGYVLGKSLTNGKGDCFTYRFAGMAFAGVRALGQFRPYRLLPKALSRLEGMTVSGRLGSVATVTKVELLPVQHVVAIETSTKTFIADGFLSHNCRMARLDMHSFVANEFLRSQGQKGLIPADKLFIMPDEELSTYLKWFKSDEKRKKTRDKQAKPSILGIGFGLGDRKLFMMNREYFHSLKEAEKLKGVIRALFPEVFAWQDAVKQKAHQQTYLQSRFGAIRWFYEVFTWDNRRGKWIGGEQAEQAVAFLPANEAFGNIRECLKELDRLGLATKYGLCNNIHDSCVFMYPSHLRDQHIAEIYPVLTAPSKVLVHPKLAPDGLRVGVECSIGASLAEMNEVKLEVEEPGEPVNA